MTDHIATAAVDAISGRQNGVYLPGNLNVNIMKKVCTPREREFKEHWFKMFSFHSHLRLAISTTNDVLFIYISESQASLC